MAISIEQLTGQITASGLMTADEVTAFVAALPESEKPADAEALAKLLVKQNQLTPFQTEQIWKGKGKQLVLGNYIITEKLGQGGMGMVLKATHKLMKRDVALKVLSPQVVKDRTAVQRFLREVEAAAKLTHPNIVAAHDADQSNGAYFLIMEYVAGQDLSQTVKKQGPATIKQAVDFILQAARGLEYAHQNGVVHRDIKPANLLLDNSGTVKVLDMGLARIEDGGVDAATQAALTGTGTIMGTVDYMAPEQAEDTKSAGPPADIYSLGASLYFLLTGKSMVTGTAIGKKLKMLMTGEGLPDSMTGLRSEVSAEVDAVFRKMTAFDMADRYQTMTEVIADLESIKAGGVPSSAATPGLQPVATRSDDSAMQSFLNKLDDGTVTTGPTVMASPKTEAGAETMASSVDEATRPGFKQTATFTSAVTEPKNRKLVMGSALVACLVVGAIVWGVSSRSHDEPAGGGSPADVNSDVKTRGEAAEPALAIAPFTADEARQHQQAWAKHLGLPVEKEVELPGGAKMKFMLIPPGEFLMGSTLPEQSKFVEEVKAANDERNEKRRVEQIAGEGPQHRVQITQPFYLGKFEVTQEQWLSVMGENPSLIQGDPSLPADRISWDSANAFLVKINERITGTKPAFSLPTEAQWEYACRAGTTSFWYPGNSSVYLREHAWFGNNAEGKSHPVGQRKPNGWGLHDMHGNLREWCADFGSSDYYRKSPDVDPVGPSSGSSRVLRGGSWRLDADVGRSASRENSHAGYIYHDIGFRLAMSIDPAQIGKARPTDITPIDLPNGEPGEALRIPHNVIRHPNSNHLGFLSDKLVLTASTNGTPTTFRLRDGVLQRKFERAWFDEGKVGAIRFAQSSNHLFGGLTDGRVCLWDIESGKIEKYFGKPAEATQDNKTFALSVSSDGKSVAASQPHGLVQVWDVETSRQIGSRQMELQVRCAFLPGSQKLGLLSGTQLAIWDAANDRIEKTYPHGLPASTDFRISPDGRYAIACDGRRPAAFCLNLRTGDLRQFSSPDAPAYFATISPDSRWLYAGGILYDLETLQPALDLTKEANGDSDSSWRLVTYAPDGRFLVVHVYSDEKSKQGIVFWRLPEKFWPRGTTGDSGVPPPADTDRVAAEWILSIGGSLKTDAAKNQAIKAIGELPREPFRMTQVNLKNNMQVSDVDLKHLQGLTNLTWIDLDSTPVSDAGLENIKELTRLETLYLERTSIDNDGLSHLRGLTRLNHLRLSSTQISDSGLVHFKPLGNLNFLVLNHTKVSDAGLEHLKGLTKLKHVKLRATEVTSAGVATLQKALPDCEIDWDGISTNSPPPAKAPFNEAQAKAHQKAWANYLELPIEKEVELPGGAKMKFMLIPSGEFMMGASDEQLKQLLAEAKTADQEATVKIEGPQHRVRITRPFYLAKYEVTQAQWQAAMGNNPAAFNKDPECPVEQVSRNDAQLFLNKLNAGGAANKPVFLLPTNAQWEFACKSGSQTRWSCGDDMAALREYCWFLTNSKRITHPVGQLKPNAFSLHDMHGNVWEWCADRFDRDYYSQSPVDDPPGPKAGSEWVTRGGSNTNVARFCTSTVRGGMQGDRRDSRIGLRLAMAIDLARLNSISSPDEPTIDVLPPAKAPFNEAQAKAHQKAWADTLEIPIEHANSIGMKFVLIPPGEFVMGGKSAEVEEAIRVSSSDRLTADYLRSEIPQHKVLLRAVSGQSGSESAGVCRSWIDAGGSRRPLERVSVLQSVFASICS